MPRRPGTLSPAQCDPTPIPRVLHARELPHAALRRLIRDDHVHQLRRGSFLYRAELEGLDPYDIERTVTLGRIAAVAQALEPGTVISHTSAVALWGLPLVHRGSKVHVLALTTPSTRNAPDVARHVQEFRPEDVVVHRGILVTSLERTVVDCARLLELRDALVIADAALHQGADLTTCWQIADLMEGYRGIRTARTVLTYADGGAESPGETDTRLCLLRNGFPMPSTQVEVETHRGTYWTDVGWTDLRVLGEYDGEAKYAANGSAVDAVLAEKRREEAIQAAGYRVFRVTQGDLRDEDTLERRVRRLARFGPRTDRPELFNPSLHVR